MVEGGEIPSTRTFAFINLILSKRHKQIVATAITPIEVHRKSNRIIGPVVHPRKPRKAITAIAVAVQRCIVHAQQQGSGGDKGDTLPLGRHLDGPAFLLARCELVAEGHYLHIQFLVLERHLHTVVLLLIATLFHSAQADIKTAQQFLGHGYAQRFHSVVNTQQSALHRLFAYHQLISHIHILVACAESQLHGIPHAGLVGADVRPQQIHCENFAAPLRGINHHQRVGHGLLPLSVQSHSQSVHSRLQHRQRHLVQGQPLALNARIKHFLLHRPVPHLLFLVAISSQREPFVELLTAYGMAHAGTYLRMCQPQALGLMQPLYI